MSTLQEIESAVAELPAEEQDQLMIFLVARRRSGAAAAPVPRRFTQEQMRGWVAEDEADMECFTRGAA